MPIAFPCPVCGAENEFPSADAGRRKVCATCKDPVRVPGTIIPLVAPPEDDPPEPPKTGFGRIVVAAVACAGLAVAVMVAVGWFVMRPKPIAEKAAPHVADLTGEVGRLRKELADYKRDWASVRDQYAKLQTENQQLATELARVKGLAVAQPVVAPQPVARQPTPTRPTPPNLKILSAVNGRPANAALFHFDDTMLEVGKLGFLDKGLYNLQILDIINDEYMWVKFQRGGQLSFVLHYKTTGLVTGKFLDIRGVWKVVGTCTTIGGATRYVLHWVSEK